MAQNTEENEAATVDLQNWDTLFDESDTKSQFDFFQGINLYNTGYVAESLLAFQRSISLKNDPLYQYMYARTSRAYGLEEQTEFIFESLFNNGYLQNYIKAKLEFLRMKDRINSNNSLSQLVRSSSIDFSKYGYVLPMTLRTLPDGNIAIVFLQSEDIIVVSPTGELLYELSTNITPVHRPFDVIYTSNNKFLVTSFSDNKIYEYNQQGSDGNSFFWYDKNKSAVPQDMIKYFSGPQYMTEGDSSSIYVTVYGSSRVFKFNQKGEYLFNFGSQSQIFSGLNQPTGIVYANNRVTVADFLNLAGKSYSRLYTFDISGNYLTHVNISDEQIESMRKVDNSIILISTKTHIYKFDYINNTIVETFTQNEFQRVMSATLDTNDVLWVIDQKRGRVETYNNLENQYSGIDTFITSVNSNNFPNIELRVNIRNSKGLPLHGLSANNIVLFENNTTVQNIVFDSLATSLRNQEHIIIVPSVRTFNNKDLRGKLLETLYSVANQGEETSLKPNKKVMFSVLDTKQVPRYIVKNTSLSRDVKNAVSNYFPNIKDETYILEGLRYAINTLIPISNGKNTILIAGDLPDTQTTQQLKVWSQIEKILNYYQIGIVWVSDTLDKDVPQYLQTILETNKHLALHTNYLDPNILEKIYNFNEFGTYSLKYKSTVTREFKEKFVPLELEANYFAGSGKDIFGYIAPNWD